MEPYIPIFWFLLVLIIPLAFLVTAYKNYIDGIRVSDIILKLVVAFIGYISTTAVTLPFMFIIIFAGAHSEPLGNAIDLKGEIFSLTLVLVYAVIGWLLCSLINGGLIKPWSAFRSYGGKTQSIFDTK